MADKSISDIEAAHRFLKDISTKCVAFSEPEHSGTRDPHIPLSLVPHPVAPCCVRANRVVLHAIPNVTHEYVLHRTASKVPATIR